MSPVIFWFRNDLRLHNQPALHAALAQGSRHLLPVLCLPDAASPTPWGFARIGPHRRAWLVSAIHGLRQALQQCGCPLLVCPGPAASVLPALAGAVGASEVLVGIEDNKPEAIAAMANAAQGSEVQVKAVPAMYPMGSEKQLIQALIRKEVPAGGRAADIGVLVHNVGTAYAVWEAVAKGRPLVSRIVTVSGGAVVAPNNLEVPIGTPVEALFQACGGFHGDPARLVLGGPMMGSQMPGLHIPVVKGTSGVLALSESEIGLTIPAPCIRCSTCVRACPVGLLPLEMASRIRAGDLNAAVDVGLKDCIACGSCSYVCPAHIPLVHYFDHAKGELAARERSKLKNEATKKLADERTARMERIAREREEAAKARAAAKAARDAAKAAEAAAKAATEKKEVVA